MKIVFNLDDVICTPAKGIKFGVTDYIDNCKPIEDTVEFMTWLNKSHHITIWCERPNDLAVKMQTEQWLRLHQVPYDRLIFDRPSNCCVNDSILLFDKNRKNVELYEMISYPSPIISLSYLKHSIIRLSNTLRFVSLFTFVGYLLFEEGINFLYRLRKT